MKRAELSFCAVSMGVALPALAGAAPVGTKFTFGVYYVVPTDSEVPVSFLRDVLGVVRHSHDLILGV